MDLNSYWQENKRFVVGVAGGVIAFGIGWMLIDTYIAKELAAARNSATKTENNLRNNPMYGSVELGRAEKENAELEAAVETLRSAVLFAPRAGFVLDQKRGSPSNQYFAVVSSTREELLTLAGRGNLRLPENLGLPALSPTRETEIERYLEALDLVDRVVRMAIETGVARIDSITMQIDPRLTSRTGITGLERTRIEMKIAGPATPLVQFLLATQSSGVGRGPLAIEKTTLQTARTSSETLLEITFVVARATT